MTKDFKAFKAEIEGSSELEASYIAFRDPYTYVKLTYFRNGEEYVAEGFAKRNPLDKPDSCLGAEIAYGRAIHEIAKRLYKQTQEELALMEPLAA